MILKALSDKHRLFCVLYAVDFNATKVAEEAGFSPRPARQSGCSLLNEPIIQAETSRLTERKLVRAGINQDEVIGTLADIARANMSNVMRWGVETVEMAGPDRRLHKVLMPYARPINSDELSDEAKAAASECSVPASGGSDLC